MAEHTIPTRVLCAKDKDEGTCLLLYLNVCITECVLFSVLLTGKIKDI